MFSFLCNYSTSLITRSQAGAWERIHGRSASRDAERRNRRSQAGAWERGGKLKRWTPKTPKRWTPKHQYFPTFNLLDFLFLAIPFL
ncbi:MAG: hypothetical protein KAI83_01180 [Thiomargarita sp.]|nr:hypothetical protein [Thiomargarita sp.]